jgi:aarF domain-containing kinase
MKNNPELEVQRTAQLRDKITSLGPFFIKLGQALSIRPDILSPRSMVELQKLCDKVPSFDSKIAYATMERELGRPISDVFSYITPEPVAAASLGQVYRATLRTNGDIVAVKVQRPKVLETVSLDLFLARQLGLILRNFPALSDRLDAVALLDEFAFRFYQELDYNLECLNGEKMKEQMRVLPDVVIPRNYPEYTSRRVHVAEWIEGEKLSQSTADDVGALVNLGVITYLTQLLDFGFFHADPHPVSLLYHHHYHEEYLIGF